MQVWHIEPKQQGLPELTDPHRLLEGAMGGTDDAHIDAGVTSSPNATEAAVSEETQQPALQA